MLNITFRRIFPAIQLDFHERSDITKFQHQRLVLGQKLIICWISVLLCLHKEKNATWQINPMSVRLDQLSPGKPPRIQQVSKFPGLIPGQSRTIRSRTCVGRNNQFSAFVFHTSPKLVSALMRSCVFPLHGFRWRFPTPFSTHVPSLL